MGKTPLSINLALDIGAEIICCDSRQVYIGMDIGTDKPPHHLQQIIAHHLIDIVYPDDEFNAHLWAEFAEVATKDIQNKNRIPLIVCGTGLYLSALTDGFFPVPEMTIEKKEQISQEIDGIEKRISLFNYLKEIDEESAKNIHPNDRYRIKRAIEIYLLTGKPATYHKKNSRRQGKKDIIYIGLTMDRNTLYRRIDQRVEDMLKNGFVEEIEYLLRLGYEESLNAFQAPGYRELIGFIEGNFKKIDAIAETKKRTRNYAKRQFTWFRKIEGVNWFDMSDGCKNKRKSIKQLILARTQE